jgi:2-amino-4-hydroxy-6-hydroxymethyldihydropteridine diphosphokinase
MPECLIGLGSNLGEREKALNEAVSRLRQCPDVAVKAVSRWIETPPVGGPAGQGPYLNGAAVIETDLPPEELLDVLQRIEDQGGRQRGERWGPRTLDLDLLLYGDLVLRTPRLEVPHPRMTVRSFVLQPAAQIAAHLVDPKSGLTIGQLWKQLCEAGETAIDAGGSSSTQHSGKQ